MRSAETAAWLDEDCVFAEAAHVPQFRVVGFTENLAVRTAAATARLEAFAAVDGLIATRLERHGSQATALAALHFEHFARCANAAGAVAAAAVARTATGATLRLTRGSAIHATARFIGEALRGEKFLFARGEREGCVAINAGEGLIGIHIGHNLEQER